MYVVVHVVLKGALEVIGTALRVEDLWALTPKKHIMVP